MVDFLDYQIMIKKNVTVLNYNFRSNNNWIKQSLVLAAGGLAVFAGKKNSKNLKNKILFVIKIPKNGLCYKLKFSNPFIFATQCRRP